MKDKIYSKINLAIIGSRGIPAKYGGFEIFTDLLATGLNKHDYNITVGCESSGSENIDTYRGVNLSYFPLPPPKNYSLRKFYEAANDIYFLLKLSSDNDIIYFLGVGTAGIFSFIPKLANKNIKLIINIDGLEWEREKFSIIEKYLLRLNNMVALYFSDVIIVDSKSLIKYIKSFEKKVTYIPYGVSDPEISLWNINILNRIFKPINKFLSIQKNKYYLVVARLEPENNIHTIIKGFLVSGSRYPLCIVGNPSDLKYMRNLLNLLNDDNDKKILFLGGIYENKLLNMLRQNAFAYIHGHSVGGTNPSLLEAMIMKNLIIAHDNEFNREVGGGSILYFNNEKDLSNLINAIENNYDAYLHLRDEAYGRVKKYYSWDAILIAYNDLFKKIKYNR